MFLRMVYDDNLAEAAYLIGCQASGEAIVIDPERDIDRYEKLAAGEGLRIVAAAETHIHADFLSGVREFAEKGARVYLSDEGDADWKYQWRTKKAGGGVYDHRLVKDGDDFKVGNIEFRVVHTPGHTPEYICFMVTDRGGGADKPIGVVTGDFVFVGDLGRPDLLETAAGIAGQAAPSAHRLFGSVRRFLDWPDYLQVWPAHGAGSACGKALGAVPQSTVGYEKRFSPAIRAASTEQAFVKFILEGQPEPPLYFARMKRDNKLGPRVLGSLPRPRALSVEELRAVNSATTAIIDTRPWAAFRAGHVPGSLNLPLTKAFSTDAGSLIGDDEDIVLVIEPSQLETAVRNLIRVGLDRITGFMDASLLDRYPSPSRSLAIIPELSVAEARALIDSRRPFLLDVRRATEFAGGHIPGAFNCSHTRLAAHLDKVPADAPVLVNCRSGVRSSRACALLKRRGRDVFNLAGGFLAWEKAGAPIQT